MYQGHKDLNSLNVLLLNSDKTEVIVLGRQHLRDTFSNERAPLDSITLAFFNFQMKHIWRTAIFYLQNIEKIRSILSQKDAEKQFHVFVA